MTGNPAIRYIVSSPDPSSHYYHVSLELEGALPESLTVAMPVWTPGSYLVREYARNLIDLKAECDGRPVAIERASKASWVVHLTKGADRVNLTYRFFAYDLSVRGSYLDTEYGLITGAALFLYVPEWQSLPLSLCIVRPDGWDTATSLPVMPEAPGWYRAENFDQLVDSPVQLGHLVRHNFDVKGVPHAVVVGGPSPMVPDLPRPSFLDDLRRIIEAAGELFQGFPYPSYQFLVTVAGQNGGGLEHKDSANIMVSRMFWRSTEHYPRLLGLFAHEYFHAWNVKRLRPVQLGPFDYQSEVYTTLLWALEGLTDYFAEWLAAQSGAIPATETLKHWAQRFRDLDRHPGRLETSLARASQEAWIRQYRPEANTPNVTVSYYLKGALAGLVLDLEMRRATQGKGSLARVMQILWQRYHDGGYPEEAVDDAIIAVGGETLRSVLDRTVHQAVELDESALGWVGLALERNFADDAAPAWLGIETEERSGRLHARFVERDSPAEKAGIAPGDELLAIDLERIETSEQWNKRLVGVPAGQSVRVDLFHQGLLRNTTVTAESPRPDNYQLVAVAQPTDAQKAAFHEWLGLPYPF